MKLALNTLTLATLAALAPAAHAEIFIDQIGNSEVSFEGLIQADYNYFDSDYVQLGCDGTISGSNCTNTINSGDGLDGDFAIRRAEIIMKGKGPGMWNWVLGYDAKDQKFLDANISYRFSGFTTLTVGQFKQPNSFEELTSTRHNDFIAKAMTTNMQGIARRTGVQLSTGGDNWTVAASYFDDELSRNRAQGAGYGLRGTFAPILSDGNILHLGLSYVDFDCENNVAQPRCGLSVRPDADLAATQLINTGTFTDGDKVNTTGLEGVLVKGPFKIQSEYMTTTISRDLNPNFKGDSWYVYGVWNLTGETWAYKSGLTTTNLPNNPDKGMWQLGVRYDTADLNDGSVNFANPSSPVVTGVMGGKESNWTLGVNWYWRSNFKFSANYVMVDSTKYSSSLKLFNDDNPNIFELRAQFYW